MKSLMLGGPGQGIIHLPENIIRFKFVDKEKLEDPKYRLMPAPTDGKPFALELPIALYEREYLNPFAAAYGFDAIFRYKEPVRGAIDMSDYDGDPANY